MLEAHIMIFYRLHCCMRWQGRNGWEVLGLQPDIFNMHSMVSLLAVRVIPMSNQHPTPHSVTVRPSETEDMDGHDWTWHNDKYYLTVCCVTLSFG